jgi:hypothetical protein
MLGMGLLNVFLGGVVGGWRCRVMMFAPLSLVAGVEGFLWSLPSPTWTTIAWQVGVLVFCLDVGYLSGSAYALYRRVPRSPRLNISTASEVSGQ